MQQSEISPQAKFRGGGPDASVDVMADDLLRVWIFRIIPCRSRIPKPGGALVMENSFMVILYP